MVRVKVCGLTDRKNLEQIAEAGIDAAGFILAESPRRVSMAEADKLIGILPPFVSSVGVVVNPSRQELQRINSSGLFDFIQFHGRENPEKLKKCRPRTIKAITVNCGEDLEEVKNYPMADYFLFDSGNKNKRGGTGRAFDWDHLQEADPNIPYILAGGLGPDSIEEALTRLKPPAVDLNSCIERSPGYKDPELLASTLKKIKENTCDGK